MQQQKILSWSTMSGKRNGDSKAAVLTKDATDAITSVGFVSFLLDDLRWSKELPSLKELLRTHVKRGRGGRGGKKVIKVVIVANKNAKPDNTAFSAEAQECYNRLVWLYCQHKDEGMESDSGERIREDIMTLLKIIDAVTIEILVASTNKSIVDDGDFSAGAVTFRSKHEHNLIYVTNIAVTRQSNGYLDDSLLQQSDYQKEVLSFLTSMMKEIHLLLAFPQKRQGLYLDLHSCILISKSDEERLQTALTALEYFFFEDTQYLMDGIVTELVKKNTDTVVMIQSGKNFYGMQLCLVVLIGCVTTFCQQITSNA